MSQGRVQGPSRAGPDQGPLTGPAHVICDLHLKGPGDPVMARFLAWMEGVPRGEALWILGDLFEYWIGSPSLADEGLTPVLQALRDRTRNGDFIGLIPGNRDFLIDAEFEAQTGVSVFPEGAILDGPEGPWLLVHGDEFCTLDLGYQRMRRVLRSKPFRFWVRHQPAFLSRAMARKLRRASKRSVPAKDPAEMAMQPDEVLRRAAAAGAGSVLCGHAHRFSDEPVPVSSSDGSSVRFMVLDAFGHGDRDVLSFARGESPRVHASAGA